MNTLELPGAMGAVVIKFAAAMFATLKRHQPKKGGREGWLDEDWDDLFEHLVSEVEELRVKLLALSKANDRHSPVYFGARTEAADEAVDVANMALMVYDVVIGNHRHEEAATKVPKRKDDLPVGGPVNHPKHYNQGGIEVIEVLKAFGWAVPFCLGNAVKYILRAEHKNNAIEDLEKARWYLDYAITYLKEKQP